MQLESLVQRLEGDTSSYVSAMDKARQALEKLFGASTPAQRNLGVVASAMDALELASKAAGGALKSFTPEMRRAGDEAERAARKIVGATAATLGQVNAVKQLLAIQARERGSNVAYALRTSEELGQGGRYRRSYNPAAESGYRQANQSAMDAMFGRYNQRYAMPVGGLGMSRGATDAERAMLAGGRTQPIPTGPQNRWLGDLGMTRAATPAERAMLAAQGRQQGATGLNRMTEIPAHMRLDVDHAAARSMRVQPPTPPGWAEQGGKLHQLMGAGGALAIKGLQGAVNGLVTTLQMAGGAVGNFLTSIFRLDSITGVIMTVTGLTTAFWLMNKAAEAVKSALHAVVGGGMDMEKTRTTFEVLMGGKAQGREMFAKIQEQSIISPYTSEQLTTATRSLLGFGVAGENVLPVLQRLGDIAGGDTERLSRLVLAYGEITEEGIVSWRRLRQLTSVGIGPQDLAKTMGIGVTELTAKLHSGQVGANIFIETINRLTSGTERFSGTQRAVLQTVAGQWTMLKNVVEIGAGKLGIAIFEKFDIAGVLGTITGRIQGMMPEITSNVLKGLDAVAVVLRELINLGGAAWDAIVSGVTRFSSAMGTSLPGMKDVKTGVEAIVDSLLNMADVVIPLVMDAFKLLYKAIFRIAEIANTLTGGPGAFTEGMTGAGMVGGGIGLAAGWGIGGALAPATGGLSLLLPLALAAGGAWGGSKIGNAISGSRPGGGFEAGMDTTLGAAQGSIEGVMGDFRKSLAELRSRPGGLLPGAPSTGPMFAQAGQYLSALSLRGTGLEKEAGVGGVEAVEFGVNIPKTASALSSLADVLLAVKSASDKAKQAEYERIKVMFQMSPEAQKVFQHGIAEAEKGLTPGDQFGIMNRLIGETERGPGQIQGLQRALGIGGGFLTNIPNAMLGDLGNTSGLGVKGGGLIGNIFGTLGAAMGGLGDIKFGDLGGRPEIGNMLRMQNFQKLQQGLGGTTDLASHLPGAAQFGSAEATDAINKAQMDQMSVMDEVKMTLEFANKQREEMITSAQEVSAALDQLAGMFPNLGI